MTKKEQLIKTAKENLGKNISPKYGSLGCVEALRFCFKQATGEELVDSYSTYILYLALKEETRFMKVKEPFEGDIILSPTGYGNGKIIGHTGIVGKNGIIYNNNSKTLLWDSHHTLESWNKRFKDIGGFPVLFYRLIEKEEVVIKENLIQQINLWEKIVRILKELLIKIKK